MAISTFTYNAFHMKTLKECMYKNTKKNCKSFKLDNCNVVRIGATAAKPYLCTVYAQWAQFGSQGIVVKCTATILFINVDWVVFSCCGLQFCNHCDVNRNVNN